MTDENAMTSYVLLKDGTLLTCSSRQKSALVMTILETFEFDKRKVRLDGRVFTLDEMEDDPEKLSKVKQNKLDL